MTDVLAQIVFGEIGPGALALAGTALGIGSLFTYRIVQSAWVLPRRRRLWLSRRCPLSDSEFAVRAGLDIDQAHLACALRRAVAGQCEVPAELIYPSDGLADLAHLAPRGIDPIALVEGIERRLSASLGPEELGRLPRFDQTQTVGVWIRRVVEYSWGRRQAA